MTHLNGRIQVLERHAARRPTAADLTRRHLLRRLSLGELEALEGAVPALESGGPLTPAQEAALAAWERVAESDEGGNACDG